MYRLLRSLLFRLEPEAAHRWALRMARLGAPLGALAWETGRTPAAPRRVMGIDFPNPVGLAAGFDKDGRYLPVWERLGFGFVELGTVTPRPQPGNPRPRLFRLPQDRALINRMGFNNEGAPALAERLRCSRYPGVVGVNIGKNRETPPERAVEDYAAAMDAVYPYADYITVNISSPNTPGLRGLQDEGALHSLIYRLQSERRRLSSHADRHVPLVVKLAPDWEEGALERAVDVLLEHRVDGISLTNTTVTRPGLEGHPGAEEEGGLSGAPLKPLATEALERARARTGGRTALMGVGGLENGEDVTDRLNRGADLVQLYTGLVYSGPALVGEAVRACAGIAREPAAARQ